MTSTGVVLLLKGPLQSWGTQSKFGHRDTDTEPSKSGVLGLVGAALGMRRDDTEQLRRLAELSMAVRVDREGRVLRDYHTAGGGTFRGVPHSVYGTGTVVTQRFYLMDACFVVALCGEDEALVTRIAGALQAPEWPLFLGRRSCAPSAPVFLSGPVTGTPRELLATVPWQGAIGAESTAPDQLRLILEHEAGKPRSDVPRNFEQYSRSFDLRFVMDAWLALDALPGAKDVPDTASTEPALA